MTEDLVLDVQDVAKTYRVGFFRKRVEAVRSVSFQIRRGEIFGLVGPNGAGKSTTIKMITGLVRPDRGQVRLFGMPVTHTAARARMGFLPENPNLYPHLKARELMRYYGGLLGLSLAESDRRAEQLLGQVGLSHALDRPISKFSKGMKQRAGIAQALLGDPEFVVLDEPQSGLDPIGRREIRDLVVELRRRGKTILFCSHILPDVEEICDRVALVHRGRVRETGFIHELLDPKILRYELFARGWSDELNQQLGPRLLHHFDVGDVARVDLRGDIDLEETLQLIARAGARVESLQPQKQRLEDVFIRDTNDAGEAQP
ncbi:ABC transporter ATP-binding protein [Lujinxingia litoralis]|uniref:ABC transporter ATP-binding protein n=1 Tax=Lujinxingia litoralis TaxID=2211119 RepID=A0A328C6A8_9DELT|nr:ABC transporter ATP-binding protein [Lujinxingia litoralis]RAL22776.1 ABC transporter ATP-binding protein [Lujinxingia litoralis]